LWIERKKEKGEYQEAEPSNKELETIIDGINKKQ
jgi:hypothetical protein